ncbi:MAG: hypothetical protein ABIU06_14240 [Anaerolineales bacterium]
MISTYFNQFPKETALNKTNHLIRLFVLVMIMLILPVAQASAGMVSCRIDPHFMLSNGDMVTVTLDIGTDPANVRNVHYILRVPAGVTVKSVVYTAMSTTKAINETYTVFQNNPAKTYTTDTVVTTQNVSNIKVTVYTRVNALAERSISGYSGQHLVMTIVKP